MKILFATDHAGFELKEILIPFVRSLGYEVEDYGAYEYDENDDYPDSISKAANEISKDPDNLKAIILGGSGQGEAIVANRYPNVRAIVFNGQCEASEGMKVPNEIVISRQHNDANIISLGARFLNKEAAKEAVKLWLETLFSGEERHVRRIAKIKEITDSIHG
ncbi:MAG: RpiB/LacA/LacB family sugar-phosphate isomerase [Candidatus Pacebacteria bacterium]|jgi:ribose 5-phosphate isomerase B|nr:RpiB/LacA/LacB family sugar-phosphate isomerase [Candidatus Paceibacterota bacterium]|tara:strand:- start:13081 stop:13569 length:489 start_codon:yes stop_codon:yes gene_type:complete